MFVSSSHELQLIKGIKWLKSISLQEVHRGLTKHYLLVPALAVKWSNVSRQTGKKRLNKTKTQQIILPKKMINQHLTDIIWYTNEHIKVRNACFFPVTIKPFYRRGGEGRWVLQMGSCLGSSAGSAGTKCPDFELCVRVQVPAEHGGGQQKVFIALLWWNTSHSSSSSSAPPNRPFFIPACMWGCAHDTGGKTRCCSSGSFCSKSCTVESLIDGAFHAWWSWKANQSTRQWAYEQEGNRPGMSFRSP